ncbi:MAG TPA: acyl-CoA dehydrogenase family protein [Thermoanaerobaculia bacterium]|nr:acyl-CoA dehydrogenase family protein [Thermoanaerobaculia bacterium]
MDFEFTPEQVDLRLAVVEFARRELNAGLVEQERSGLFCREKWEKAARFGLLGLPLPEAYGGAACDLLTTVHAMEGLGYGCRDNGLVFAMNAHIWSAEVPILRFGTEEQKERYLPRLVSGEWIAVHAITEEGSGSDAFNLAATAIRRGDRYVLNGSKVFITNAPVADLILFFATVDRASGPDGISAFLVERTTPGLAVTGGFEKMGLRTAPMGQVFLDDCEVLEGQRLGGEGAGAAIFNASMDYERACILAAGVGTLERQLEDCIERARTWKRFGKPIGKFQSISNKVADMKVRLETARLLLYKAAWLKAAGQRASMESAMAKLYVSECMVQSGLDAIQIFGGYGYMADYGIERDLRDAIGGTIYSGTSEIQRMIVARHLGL